MRATGTEVGAGVGLNVAVAEINAGTVVVPVGVTVLLGIIDEKLQDVVRIKIGEIDRNKALLIILR